MLCDCFMTMGYAITFYVVDVLSMDLGLVLLVPPAVYVDCPLRLIACMSLE